MNVLPVLGIAPIKIFLLVSFCLIILAIWFIYKLWWNLGVKTFLKFLRYSFLNLSKSSFDLKKL